MNAAPKNNTPAQISALIAIDFDGTLAEISNDPSTTRPVEGVTDALHRLGEAGVHVAIVSGRPLDFLLQHFKVVSGRSWMTLIGEYGIEQVHAGQRRQEPFPEHMANVLNEAANHARAQGPDGMAVEQKPHSMTLHYRTAPQLEDTVKHFAEHLGLVHGLETRLAKMSVELHPQVTVSKGTALTSLINELQLAHDNMFPVVFIGDDVGDLPAFAVLRTLREEGWNVTGVVVESAESPPQLLQQADVRLESPYAVVDFLNHMAANGLTFNR